VIDEKLVYRQGNPDNISNAYWVISDRQRGIEVEVELIGASGYEFLSVVFVQPLLGTFEYDMDDSLITKFLRNLMLRQEVYRVKNFLGRVVSWSLTNFSREDSPVSHAVGRFFGFKYTFVDFEELLQIVGEKI